MEEIYLDYGATTPVREDVMEVALPYFIEKFGNPSSFHSTGLQGKKALQKSREKIAKILNCNENEIIFTGSGTESINLAIKGIAFKQTNGGHFITQKTEHHAVLETMEWLQGRGFSVTYLGVNKNGLIDLDELRKSIKKNTKLVSIMYANNETGVIQPIREIAKICKEKKVLFHVDGCQGAEYLELDVQKLGADMLTLNGSKVYAFKGTGLLYKRKGVEIEPLVHGGSHENGLRAGTENVAGIVALARALEVAEKEKKIEKKRLEKLRDYFIKRVEKEIPKVHLNGDRKKRLPNNVNISFEGVEGESILLRLNEVGIRVSTGSACTSQTLDPSHVLLAMGISHELAHGSIRFSFGKDTNQKKLDYVISELKKEITLLRKISPVWRG